MKKELYAGNPLELNLLICKNSLDWAISRQLLMRSLNDYTFFPQLWGDDIV